MDKYAKRALKAVKTARNFPANTCGASRHVQMIGESLVRGEPYPMLQEEADHCGGDMLFVVAALYSARSKIAELEARLGLAP